MVALSPISWSHHNVLLPLLAAETPELPLRVTELTALVRADDALLDREAERLLLPAPEPLFSDPCVLRRVRLAPLREAPEPLQRRALRCLLLPVLKQFRRRYPGVQIRVSNHSTPQAIAALQEGLVDFALVTTPLELGKDMVLQTLKTVREVPVCGPGLNCPDTLSPEDLCRYPLVCLGRDTMSYRFYEEWFRKLSLPFQPDIEAATADQILPMAASDLGIGFVPEEFLAGNQDVRILSLSVPEPQRNICLVSRTGQPLRIAAQEFKHILQEHISL